MLEHCAIGLHIGVVVVHVCRHLLLSLHRRHDSVVWLMGCSIARHLRCAEGIVEVGLEGARLGRLIDMLLKIAGRGCRRGTWEGPVYGTEHSINMGTATTCPCALCLPIVCVVELHDTVRSVCRPGRSGSSP